MLIAWVIQLSFLFQLKPANPSDPFPNIRYIMISIISVCSFPQIQPYPKAETSKIINFQINSPLIFNN